MASKAATTTKGPKQKRSPSTKNKGQSHKAEPPFITLDRLIDFAGILIALVGVLTGLAMIPSSEPSLAQPWLDFLSRVLGVGTFASPFAMLGFGVWLMARRFENAPAPPWYRLLGGFLFALSLLALIALYENWGVEGEAANSGGLLGFYLMSLLVLAVGRVGALVVLLFINLQGLLFLLERSLADVGRALSHLRLPRRAPAALARDAFTGPDTRNAIQLSLPSIIEVREQTRAWWEQFVRLSESTGSRKPTPVAPPTPNSPTATTPPMSSSFVSDTPWRLPPWPSLLEESLDTDVNLNDIRTKAIIIEETLAHFGVPARVIEVNRGPTVTQYGVEPGFIRKQMRGGVERTMKVKVSAITHLQNDLALALSAARIRIEAPVPGQNYVGIEVPNDHATAVTLHGTMESEEFQALAAPLKVALGRDVMGNIVMADLAKMPHLLIAGSTGSGKSVCINSIICCLLCNNTPDQLKLLMVDPKMVELVGYNGIPHLIVPVVTELDRVVGLLRWTVTEMERRYKLFSERRVRNLEGYNSKALKEGQKPLPYLVLIIDKLADLMMAAADQVESMICRLAQMARATGIHLILATQRPSVDVVTGLIKANFPARIAFAVTSLVDSRVILDRSGAEALLGRGDMLYIGSDSSVLRRAQGCYVSDRELERINHFWLEQATELARGAQSRKVTPKSESHVDPVQEVLWDDLLESEEEALEDPMLVQAREIVRKAGSASVSMLQRRLRVGYARAARLIDIMEEEGTIGTSEGPGKTRAVHREGVEPGSDDDPGFDPAWINEE
ncbi:MAG: DNA translocase FtsK 4TM domain-containing protein [Ardenticatenales bacterium]|nr:DNA translocase FtsK 4TM domain-containing protein [Ardenticatenales bacterium]